jgi:histidine ammonia-lyase
VALIIGNDRLTINKLIQVARFNERVELHSDAVIRINKCRKMLEKKIQSQEIIYGLNTGIGEFSEVVLDDNQLQDFQRYLIYNHAAGIGDPAPIEYVRGAMISRINVHVKGQSGCRLEITQALVEMLNKGVTPHAPTEPF